MPKFNIIDDFFLSDTFSQRAHDLWNLCRDHFSLHIECSSISSACRLIKLLAPNEFSLRAFASDKSSSSWSFSTQQTLPADFSILIPLPQHVYVYASRKKGQSVHFYFISKDPDLRQRAGEMANLFLTGNVVFTVDSSDEHPTALVKSAYFDNDHDFCTSSTSRVNTKPLSEVFTAEENKSHLLSYLTRWMNASKLFDSLGITYKLGILLYGPPGTGKTTLVKTIASILSYTVYAVDMSNFPTTPPSFDDLDDAIILFEDIDYIFSSAAQENDGALAARANALLQTLDGVHSSSNLIFIATTNDVNALNGALVRDGRFDLKIEMDELAERSEAEAMCKSYGLPEAAAETLVKDMPLPINQAALQNKCIQWIFDSFKDDERSEEVSEDERSEDEEANKVSEEVSKETKSTSAMNAAKELQLRINSSIDQTAKALDRCMPIFI